MFAVGKKQPHFPPYLCSFYRKHLKNVADQCNLARVWNLSSLAVHLSYSFSKKFFFVMLVSEATQLCLMVSVTTLPIMSLQISKRTRRVYRTVRRSYCAWVVYPGTQIMWTSYLSATIFSIREYDEMLRL